MRYIGEIHHDSPRYINHESTTITELQGYTQAMLGWFDGIVVFYSRRPLRKGLLLGDVRIAMENHQN